MTLSRWLREAATALGAAGRDAPRLCAELLACRVLHMDRTDLVLHRDRPLDPQERAGLEKLLSRRRQGEPLAYILGFREFYGRPFAVDPSTLIPRPETEHLIETALDAASSGSLVFADMGTGSGCIAVTLAAERPDWRGFAVDRSRAALRTARRNASTHRVRDRLVFLQADMHRPLFAKGSLDLLVSNPPYVSSAEYAELSEEVLREPASALVPQFPERNNPAMSGLETLDRLIEQAGGWLRPGGWLVLEHGSSQAPQVAVCLSGHRWEECRVIADLAGHQRVTAARLAVP